jgi:hypothetical protein
MSAETLQEDGRFASLRARDAIHQRGTAADLNFCIAEYWRA